MEIAGIQQAWTPSLWISPDRLYSSICRSTLPSCITSTPASVAVHVTAVVTQQWTPNETARREFLGNHRKRRAPNHSCRSRSAVDDKRHSDNNYLRPSCTRIVSTTDERTNLVYDVVLKWPADVIYDRINLVVSCWSCCCCCWRWRRWIMRTDEINLIVQIHVDDETILARLETVTSSNHISRYWFNSQLAVGVAEAKTSLRKWARSNLS